MKKFNNLSALFVIFAIILSTTGCGRKELSPSQTLRAFYVAANASRYSEAVGFLNKTARTLHELSGLLGQDTLDQMSGKGKEIEKISVLEERMQEKEATVTIEVRFRDGSVITRAHPLMKEGGAWKIGRLSF